MNLTQLRNKLNFTQGELAEKLSVDRSTISKWETNKAFPSTGKLMSLSKILRCTADELLL